MQYTITINQLKALEWGLNAQQTLLFAFVYECPSWANPIKTDTGIYFALSKAKIVDELPLLTDKPDTAYRLLKALRDAGLIDLSSTSSITLVRLTEKAKEWNRKIDGSEKYPTSDAIDGRIKNRSTTDKNPSKVGNKSEPGSDKSPTNQDTNNQGTNQVTSNQDLQDGSDKPNRRALTLVAAHTEAPRVEIPGDMPGPKDQTCKTFKTWANYAMSYRKRYSAWPVWNAKVGGQIGQLIDRLGIDVAHSVAAYFVGINDAHLIRKYHGLGELLVNAEAYHTQWATNAQMNSTTAQQIERKQANLTAGQDAARRIMDREGRKANEFM